MNLPDRLWGGRDSDEASEDLQKAADVAAAGGNYDRANLLMNAASTIEYLAEELDIARARAYKA